MSMSVYDELGFHYVGMIANYGHGGRRLHTNQFFTVDDGSDVYVYQRPPGLSARDIRIKVAVTFIDEMDLSLDYRVVGRYPNYQIEEITG
jgi:hypothetical protein